MLQSRLRQSIAASQEGKKVSPREIQTHIRAGLSAFEVAELTGASVDYVERFEGPVVAERQFMVESALKVPVQPTSPADPLGEEPLTTFGDALWWATVTISTVGAGGAVGSAITTRFGGPYAACDPSGPTPPVYVIRIFPNSHA